MYFADATCIGMPLAIAVLSQSVHRYDIYETHLLPAPSGECLGAKALCSWLGRCLLAAWWAVQHHQ